MQKFACIAEISTKLTGGG